jgi:hypothetical protein
MQAVDGMAERGATDKNRPLACLLAESFRTGGEHADLLVCPSVSGFNKLAEGVSKRPGERAMGKFDARISRRARREVYSSAFRPPRALFLRLLVVVALVPAASHAAFASGEERTTVGDDLVIRTDTRWAGGALGGYLPVRVEVSNHAKARSLVFEVTPADRTQGATVKRVIGVDEQATARFTLSIPLTAFRQGILRVYDRREELQSHARGIGGASFLNDQTAPSLLMVSTRPVDCSDYIRAASGSPDVTRSRPKTRASRHRFVRAGGSRLARQLARFVD